MEGLCSMAAFMEVAQRDLRRMHAFRDRTDPLDRYIMTKRFLLWAFPFKVCQGENEEILGDSEVKLSMILKIER